MEITVLMDERGPTVDEAKAVKFAELVTTEQRPLAEAAIEVGLPLRALQGSDVVRRRVREIITRGALPEEIAKALVQARLVELVVQDEDLALAHRATESLARVHKMVGPALEVGFSFGPETKEVEDAIKNVTVEPSEASQ
jgi:hypothetical protein